MDIYVEIMARMEDKVERQVDTCNNRVAVYGQDFKGKVGSTMLRWVWGLSSEVLFRLPGCLPTTGWCPMRSRGIWHTIKDDRGHV